MFSWGVWRAAAKAKLRISAPRPQPAPSLPPSGPPPPLGPLRGRATLGASVGQLNQLGWRRPGKGDYYCHSTMNQNGYHCDPDHCNRIKLGRGKIGGRKLIHFPKAKGLKYLSFSLSLRSLKTMITLYRPPVTAGGDTLEPWRGCMSNLTGMIAL